MSAHYFCPPPYPLHRFHLLVAEAARELKWNLKAPDALIGMSLLATMSTVSQDFIDVRLPTGQLRPVSLYIIGVAESGERKTTVDYRVAEPIHEHDDMLMAQYEAGMARYAKELSLWKDTHRALRRKRAKLIEQGKPLDGINDELDQHHELVPSIPKLRQIIRSDITGRALADALHGDSESIAVMVDEGDIILRSEIMRQLGMLNAAWDGSSLKLDRADGKRVLARNPRVTLSIRVQPVVIRQYLDNHGEHARGSGHFSRYLVGWPVSTQGNRCITPLAPCWGKLEHFHQRVKQLLCKRDKRLHDSTMERTVIEFTDEAKAEWIKLANDVERSLHPVNGSLHDIADFGSKLCEIVGRVAAILHFFTEQDGNIDADTLHRAVDIVGWHTDEFQRLFGESTEVSIAHADSEVLARWLHAHIWQPGYNHMPRNDLLSVGPARLRKKRRLDPALDILIENRTVWIGSDNSKKRYVYLNPNFFNNYRSQ